jgi:hypothetical protein
MTTCTTRAVEAWAQAAWRAWRMVGGQGAGFGAFIHTYLMSELRRSDRKRRQTDFLEGTEAGRDKTTERALSARLAHEAAVESAYEPLVGLKQLGAMGGGEGRVWVGEPGEDGAEDSPALGGFAPTPADRLRFLELVQRYRDANPVRGGASGSGLASPPQRADPRVVDLRACRRGALLSSAMASAATTTTTTTSAAGEQLGSSA